MDGFADPYGGTIANPLLPAFSQYSLNFTNRYRYIIPVFELFNQNGIGGDSRVYLDNVVLTQQEEPVVPEPASCALLGLGLSLLICGRRRPRTIH
jgi:hypothetical protein